MAEQSGGAKKRFGVFEFDSKACELTKHGVRLKVQDQPLQILTALLEQAGRVVTREDLQKRLWPDGTFVDFEQSLNKAVNKLREALGDSASHPIYIETLSRRGYRFLAPVEEDRALEPPARALRSRRPAVPWLATGGLSLGIALATGLWPIDVPQVESVSALTNDTTLKAVYGRLISNGDRVLYDDGHDVSSVPASGGEMRKLSLPFLESAGMRILSDYSPLRRQILIMTAYNDDEPGINEAWLAGTEGERPRKIAEIKPPCRGALAPDAGRVALSRTDGIYIQSVETGESTRVHPMNGMSPALWWHPSGKSVGFVDPLDDPRKIRVWQVNDDGTHLRRIVPEKEHRQGAGAWSLDGRRFFYLGGEGEVYVRAQPGLLGWLRKPVVTRLTAGGHFRTPPAVDPVNPRRLYALGSVLRGQTMRYDRDAGRWVPFLGAFSGEKIDRSPDGQWLAYISYPIPELHKCRIDGTGDVVLAPGVEAMNPSWSPDGKQIAFSGRPPGTTVEFKLWMVSSGGGDAVPYPRGIESGYDTTWSRDGTRILLGHTEFAEGLVRILHLGTGELEPVAGTGKLFSVRWAPGEKQMIGTEMNTDRPFILDPVKGEWRPLGESGMGYPKWSDDGKYIYGGFTTGTGTRAIRVDAVTGRREEIAVADFKLIENGSYWVGWTEKWEPLMVRDLSSTQVYRIDLDR